MRRLLPLLLAMVVLVACGDRGATPPAADVVPSPATDVASPPSSGTPGSPAADPPVAPPRPNQPAEPGAGAGPGAAVPTPQPDPASGAQPAPAAPAPHPGVLAGAPGRCFAAPADGTRPAPPYLAVGPGAASTSYATSPDYVVAGAGCQVAIGGGSVYVSLVLPADVNPGLLQAALQVTGGGSDPQAESSSQDRVFSIWFDHAPPGAEHSVRLQGPLTPGGPEADLEVTLVRDYPEVIAELRQDDGPWEPLDPLVTYPPVATSLRLRFSAPVDQGVLAQRVRENAALARLGPAAARWGWTDELTFEVGLTQPPPLLLLDPGGLPDRRGVGSWAPVAVLRTGEPPMVVAFDPDTGSETVVAPAPPEAVGGVLSPDGRWLAVPAWVPSAHAYWHWWDLAAPVVDLHEARLLPSPLETVLGWGPGGQLVGPNWGAELTLWHPETAALRRLPLTADVRFYSISPDRRRAAGYVLDWRREDPNSWLVPADLVVVDLQSGAEQWFRNGARYYSTHSEQGPPFPILWDGSGAIVAREYAGLDAWTWVRWDLATGRRTEVPPGQAGPLEVAQDGSAPDWYGEQADWGALQVPLPGGGAAKLGPGLPVGWGPDGRYLFIRWAGYEQRHMPYCC